MLAAELRASTAKPSPVLIWGALGGLAELLWWSSLQTNLNLRISYLRTAEILTPKSRCLITGVQCNKGRGCEILKLAFFMRLSNSESRVTLGFIIYSVRAGQALLVYRLQLSFLNPVRTSTVHAACQALAVTAGFLEIWSLNLSSCRFSPVLVCLQGYSVFLSHGNGATAPGSEGTGQASCVTLLLQLLLAVGCKNFHLKIHASISLSKEAEPGFWKHKRLFRLSGFKFSAVPQSSVGTNSISTPVPDFSQGRGLRTHSSAFSPPFFLSHRDLQHWTAQKF